MYPNKASSARKKQKRNKIIKKQAKTKKTIKPPPKKIHTYIYNWRKLIHAGKRCYYRVTSVRTPE
jgi:hypothetical protein